MSVRPLSVLFSVMLLLVTQFSCDEADEGDDLRQQDTSGDTIGGDAHEEPLGSTTNDCSPPSADYEGTEFAQQAHIAIDPRDCTCSVGSGYSSDGLLTLDLMPASSTGAGSMDSDSPYSVSYTEPESIYTPSEYIYFDGIPLDQPVVIAFSDGGFSAALRFTMSPSYLGEASITCPAP